MIVDTKYIKKEISKIWPHVKPVLWDPKYWLIPEKQIGQLIVKSTVKDMTFISNFNDCDNFGLQFQAETRRKRYLAYIKEQESGNVPEELRYPVAVAIAHGTMWRGMSKNHVANLFVCQEGIYLADLTPMEKRYWKASSDNDKILSTDFR